jgi:uracil-DNA glycosylase
MKTRPESITGAMKPPVGSTIDALLREIRACRRCVAVLPHGPRPVVRASATARILIVGQAPGRRVHTTGIPWNDPSGDLLRAWLDIDRDHFYDERVIAIAPIGLCYPGTGKSGDLPPRPECAPLWHPRLREQLPDLRLTLLIGAFAHAFYLGRARKKSLTETVLAFNDAPVGTFPLPHPSPRNRRWLRDRPWFERKVIPALRARFRAALA